MFCNARNGKCLALLCFLLSFPISLSQAQNPIVRDQFSADPSARVFNGKMYVFPSHDIKAPEGKGLRPDWFCMEDYHVRSEEHTSELQSRPHLVCRLLLEKKKNTKKIIIKK